MPTPELAGGGLWAVPRIFEGFTVAVFATGPSANEADAALLRRYDIPCIAVNNGYEYMPDARILYACDAKWWAHYRQRGVKGGPGWESFQGLRVTLDDPKREPEFPALLRLGNGGAWGFDDRTDYIRTGKNSACQAVHVAAHAGAKRILLLGCDCCHGSDGRAHEFGEHKWMETRLKRDMNNFLEGWRLLAPELKQRGIDVINCSLRSAIADFPKMTLQELLCKTN